MNIAVISILVLLIATMGGWQLGFRRPTDEKQVKIVLFMVYFWLLFFAQIAILAVVYHYGKKYGIELKWPL